MAERPIGRRGILGAAGVLTGGLIAGRASSAAAGQTTRGLNPGRDFRLTGGGRALFTDVPLHDETIMQSFAFDNINRRVYTVQLMAGGNQLPDEDAPVSGGDRAGRGDLCITQLDLDGNERGHMYLPGFGHGVQIGVETIGRRARLWCGTASDTTGYATRVGAFDFRDGAILRYGSPLITCFDPIRDAEGTIIHTDIATDVVHHRLLVRYIVQDVGARYAWFRGARPAGRPAADVVSPPLGTFQGYAPWRDRGYLLSGDHSATAEPSPGNTTVTTIDLRTGEVLDAVPIAALPELSYREPEGMSILLTEPRHPDSAQLCLGFAIGEGGDRRATIVVLEEQD